MSVRYEAVLDVSPDCVAFMTGLLDAERARRGTRRNTRRLSTQTQAVLVLRWFLDDTRMVELYFLLSGLLDRSHLLSKGLAIILGFIGVKLVLQAAHKTISQAVPEIPSLVSLAVIIVVLTVTMVLSLRKPAPVAPSSGDDARPPAQADERG